VLLEGRARAGAGDVTWELQPGDALLWTPGQAHGFTVDPASPCRRWNLWFACAPALPALATPVLQQHTAFQQDFALWWADLLGQAPGWDYRVRGRLELLLHWLVTAQLPARADTDCPTTPGEFVERIEAYLQDNLANIIILDDLAVHLGVSVSMVTRAFRQAHGISVMAHLQTLRMREAATLLDQTDLPVAVIGARIGLDDPSYFCRRFRQYYRVTPLQYRRQGTTPSP
jgi:AraC-like DNA-binding protein